MWICSAVEILFLNWGKQAAGKQDSLQWFRQGWKRVAFNFQHSSEIRISLEFFPFRKASLVPPISPCFEVCAPWQNDDDEMFSIQIGRPNIDTSSPPATSNQLQRPSSICNHQHCTNVLKGQVTFCPGGILTWDVLIGWHFVLTHFISFLFFLVHPC